MPRVALDLEQKDDLAVIKSDGWRVAQGLEPGEPNQGLVAEKAAAATPACLTTTIPAGRAARTFRSAIP